MSVTFSYYNDPDDYNRIADFLTRHYQPGNQDGNWIEPAWEYMHGHPYLDRSALGKIGLWKDDAEIVSITHYEWRLGEAFFEFHPGYRYLRHEMLDYAEDNFYGWSEKDNRQYLCVYVNDTDEELGALVSQRGYERKMDDDRPMAAFEIPDPFPSIKLPKGFCLSSLADECDWAKVQRALWRGFNHEGEPPTGEDDLEERRKMFDTPKARRDLKIVVKNPDGDYVAFCGMFYEPTHRYGYVEPVAADPDYRRRGLGKAAVLEGIRRCGALGATVAYVGSEQEFYLSLGFKVLYTSECWAKFLP